MLHEALNTVTGISIGDVLGAVGLAALLFVVWRIVEALTARDANRTK